MSSEKKQAIEELVLGGFLVGLGVFCDLVALDSPSNPETFSSSSCFGLMMLGLGLFVGGFSLTMKGSKSWAAAEKKEKSGKQYDKLK